MVLLNFFCSQRIRRKSHAIIAVQLSIALFIFSFFFLQGETFGALKVGNCFLVSPCFLSFLRGRETCWESIVSRVVLFVHSIPTSLYTSFLPLHEKSLQPVQS